MTMDQENSLAWRNTYNWHDWFRGGWGCSKFSGGSPATIYKWHCQDSKRCKKKSHPNFSQTPITQDLKQSPKTPVSSKKPMFSWKTGSKAKEMKTSLKQKGLKKVKPSLTSSSTESLSWDPDKEFISPPESFKTAGKYTPPPFWLNES